MDHSNLFHAALTEVHDIAENGPRDWERVLGVVEMALVEARRLDREVERKWPKSPAHT